MNWIPKKLDLSQEVLDDAFPITIIYIRGGVDQKYYYMLKCDVCKKTPCKHFIFTYDDPIITKEAILINKLLRGTDYDSKST